MTGETPSKKQKNYNDSWHILKKQNITRAAHLGLSSMETGMNLGEKVPRHPGHGNRSDTR